MEKHLFLYSGVESAAQSAMPTRIDNDFVRLGLFRAVLSYWEMNYNIE